VVSNLSIYVYQKVIVRVPVRHNVGVRFDNVHRIIITPYHYAASNVEPSGPLAAPHINVTVMLLILKARPVCASSLSLALPL
jgi:hypothetical protein